MEILGVAWENILIGILAALFVGGVIRVKDITYDKYLEWQYPIAGEYITRFEDEKDGEEITVTAPAKIEQQGKTITGRTKMPDDDREWHLKGEISENGYINGIYYAIDPHDRGVGNLFLYVNYDRQMEGLWSGYDEVNDKISSGRYTFIPVFDAFTIRPIESSEIPMVLDIAEQRLGKAYLSAELVERALDTESPYFVDVASVDAGFEKEQSIATRLADALLDRSPDIGERAVPSDSTNREVIGFSLGAVFNQDELQSYLNISDEDLPDSLRSANKVGVIRTVAVRRDFENRGVATELVEESISKCFDNGATALCAVGWEEEGHVNIGGLMNHFDFQELMRVEEYWKDESVEEGYYCESCGNPPCTCAAVIFVRY